jgi:GPI mannosyltransferase 3
MSAPEIQENISSSVARSGQSKPSLPASGKYRLPVLLFTAVLLIALALRVGMAIGYENMDWPDEVFQTREAAHHLVYQNWAITWEFRRGARSWVFPAFLSVVMRLSNWIGPESAGSEGYLLGIKIVLSLLSLSATGFVILWAYRAGGWPAAIIAACLGAFWYELIYYAPKALNEVVAGHCLLPGLYLGAFEAKNGKANNVRLALAGLCFGLAVALRMQLAPVVVLAAAYLCASRWKEKLPFVVAGLLFPVIVFGLVDWVTWSYPFQSYIENFRFNAIFFREHPSGTTPVYWYLIQLPVHFGPIAFLAIIGWRRSPILGWVILALLIPHSLVPHKEYRFLYPILSFVLILAALGLAELCNTLAGWLRWRYTKPALVAISCLYCVILSISIGYRDLRWKSASGPLIAFRNLSHDLSVCGVAIVQDDWFYYGGYTYLHRDVPVYVIPRTELVRDMERNFNAMVTPARLPYRFGNFELLKCQGGVCTYRRAGQCEPNKESKYEITNVLKGRKK